MTPKPKPRKNTRLAGLLSAAAKIKRVQVSKLMSWAAAGGMECAHSVVLGLIRAERRRKRGKR